MVNNILSKVHSVYDGMTGPFADRTSEIVNHYFMNTNKIVKDMPKNTRPCYMGRGGGIHANGRSHEGVTMSTIERLFIMAISRLLNQSSESVETLTINRASAINRLQRLPNTSGPAAGKFDKFTIGYDGSTATYTRSAIYLPTKEYPYTVLYKVTDKGRMSSGEPTAIYKIRTDLARKTNKEIYDFVLTKSAIIFKCRSVENRRTESHYYSVSPYSNLFALGAFALMIPTIINPEQYKMSIDPEKDIVYKYTDESAEHLKKLQLNEEMTLVSKVLEFIRSKLELYSTTTDKLSLTMEEEEELVNIFREYYSKNPCYNFDDTAKYPDFSKYVENNYLNEMKEGYLRIIKNTILRRIENIKNDIDSYLRRIRNLQADLFRFKEELYTAGSKEKFMEDTIKYVISLVQKSPVIKSSSVVWSINDNDETIPTLIMYEKQPTGISDAEKWKSSFPNIMGEADFSPEEKVQYMRLFEDIWNNHRFNLMTGAIISLDVSSGRVYANRDYYLDNTEFPNPHIMGYNCFGTYEVMIQQAIMDSKYDEAMELALAACSEINWADPPVIRRLLTDMYEMKDDVKGIIDTKTNKRYSIQEIFDMYKAEDEAAKATSTATTETETTATAETTATETT